MKLIHAGLGKIRLAPFVLVWGDNLVLLLLGFAWLQIPDSHTWEFALSMLSALALVCAFCWLQVSVFARLRTDGGTGALWVRMLGFAVVFAVWFFAAHWIASGNNGVPQVADYWNSKLSAGHRVVLTPERIGSALGWGLLVAQLLLAAILIPVAMELGARGLRRLRYADVMRPWKRWVFWVVVIAGGVCAVEATTLLVNWVPGRGVGMQTFSVLGRLLVAWTLDALLWLAALATAAAAMDEGAHAPSEANVVMS